MTKRFIIKTPFLVAAAIVLLVNSCANMATPTGGIYDVDPPRMLQSTPPNNSLNVDKRVVEILFDENVKVEKAAEKVIVTPPQINMPVIKALGKRVVVELNDTLQPNTTYIIDFTDAIVDNNEGNPLENFSFSFSTGDHLDTLAVSGSVLAADNLEPMPGLHVGLHTNMDDTAFVKVPFERISRTDSRGRFTVRGLAAGSYKVFALEDLNRDYKYDNPQETLAFLDSIIIPTSMPAVRQDTIFRDSLTIDTILTVNYTRFLPDDLQLRSFLSPFQRKYFQKSERPRREKLDIFFAAPSLPPQMELLTPARTGEEWYVLERSAGNDSLFLWITDSLIYREDTLALKIDYLMTDTLNRDALRTDTMRFTFKEPRQPKKEKKEEEEEEPIRFLGLKHNLSGTHEIYAPIRFEFDEPVNGFDFSLIKLSQEVDSVFSDVAFTLQTDSLNPRKYTLVTKWEPGGKYRLNVDSATVYSVYGLWNNKLEQNFSVKELNQYGNLLFRLSGLPAGKTAYVELLDKSDKPFRKVRVKNNEALIFDINPGAIYARLFIDENDDGVWTTGDYEHKRQPEEVFYYPRTYEIRAFTDHEEDWDIRALPLNQQKPLEITKNKPEEKKRRDLNEERQREQQQNQRGSSPFQSGTGSLGGAGGQMQRMQPGR